jgi:phosphoglycolate phosphatase-like HAD superfamily hydrolase
LEKFHFAFDFDMTLADTREAEIEAFQKLFRLYHSSERVVQDCMRFVGKGLKLQQILISTLPEQEATTASELFKDIFRQGMGQIKPMPGATEILEFLKAKEIEISVISAKSKENLDVTMKSLGMTDIEAHGGLFGKDKTLKLIEVGADLYVGDQESDIEAANSAGCISILVNSKTHRFKLASSPPDLRYKDLNAFKEGLSKSQSIEESLNHLLVR